MNGLLLDFGVAEDPTTTTTELSDLILSGSVSGIFAKITNSDGTPNFGLISPSVTTYSITEVTPTPLPAALPLLLSGLGGLGFMGWRRKKAVAA